MKDLKPPHTALAMTNNTISAMTGTRKRTRKSVPDWMKRKIIDLVITRRQMKADVAWQFDLSHSMVSTIVCKFEHTGECSTQRICGAARRISKVTDKHIKIMLDFIALHPAVLQRRRPADRKQNMSLLVAVGCEGLIAARPIIGGWTADLFVDFLQSNLMPELDPHRKRVFILDNAQCHKTEDVRAMITAAGHSVLYLPPYTPWFNICERVFSKIKPIVSCQELEDHETLEQVIYDQLSRITTQDCEGWIRESKRWRIITEHGHPLGADHDAQAALARHGLLPNQELVDKFVVTSLFTPETDDSQDM
ncbi:uncharacterized protein SPSC_00008 [Sporisorium scitamineum]|uniref:Tc1-like transposase DDE domain-containing protein n=1 Tax=Sporisorium scitamineum TaxID=49012 RepID=A0A140KLV7_9BASI|nr:uncharacterized protein SPSC_00008 [Sporisorium scitamineum]